MKQPTEDLDRENLYHDRRVKLPSEPERVLPQTPTEHLTGQSTSVDKRANPEGLHSAHGYHGWLSGRHSVSQDQLGLLGHLDDQEAMRGYTSFPEEHEWHPANRERTLAAANARIARRQAIANYVTSRTGVDEDPIKRNTFETTCASCKQPLRAGEGVFAKTDRGYKVVHEHGCEPKAGRPAGKPRTSTWIGGLSGTRSV